jgi:hypothetical protein
VLGLSAAFGGAGFSRRWVVETERLSRKRQLAAIMNQVSGGIYHKSGGIKGNRLRKLGRS